MFCYFSLNTCVIQDLRTKNVIDLRHEKDELYYLDIPEMTLTLVFTSLFSGINFWVIRLWRSCVKLFSV